MTLFPGYHVPAAETTKRCWDCGAHKPLNAFATDKSRGDGLACRCRACMSVYSRAYYAANRERARFQHAAYYQDNRERLVAAGSARVSRRRQEQLAQLAATTGVAPPLCACGCGQYLKPRRDGKAQRYLRGHSDAGRLVEVRCAACGILCDVHAWRLERAACVYCSRQCAAVGRRRDITAPCAHCGKIITYKPWKKKRPCCSHACAMALRRAGHHERVAVRCVSCGRELWVYASVARRSKNHYCNHACRALHITGPVNPSYTGGRGRNGTYGPHWRRNRRQALRRDAHTCRLCGKKPLKRWHLHVHHIVPIYWFNGDYERADALENLITLCLPCHRKEERFLHTGGTVLLAMARLTPLICSQTP